MLNVNGTPANAGAFWNARLTSPPCSTCGRWMRTVPSVDSQQIDTRTSAPAATGLKLVSSTPAPPVETSAGMPPFIARLTLESVQLARVNANDPGRSVVEYLIGSKYSATRIASTLVE